MMNHPEDLFVVDEDDGSTGWIYHPDGVYDCRVYLTRTPQGVHADTDLPHVKADAPTKEEALEVVRAALYAEIMAARAAGGHPAWTDLPPSEGSTAHCLFIHAGHPDRR